VQGAQGDQVGQADGRAQQAPEQPGAQRAPADRDAGPGRSVNPAGEHQARERGLCDCGATDGDPQSERGGEGGQQAPDPGTCQAGLDQRRDAPSSHRTERARVSSTLSSRTPHGARPVRPVRPAAFTTSAWFTDHHYTPYSLATSAAERVETDTACSSCSRSRRVNRWPTPTCRLVSPNVRRQQARSRQAHRRWSHHPRSGVTGDREVTPRVGRRNRAAARPSSPPRREPPGQSSSTLTPRACAKEGARPISCNS